MKKFDKTVIAIIYFIIVILLFDSMRDNKALQEQIKDCNKDFRELDSLYSWKSKRLKVYVPICLEQSKIIDKFRSSRNEAVKNERLSNLQTKLD